LRIRDRVTPIDVAVLRWKLVPGVLVSPVPEFHHLCRERLVQVP